MADLIYRLRLHLARLIDPRPPSLVELQDSINRTMFTAAADAVEAAEAVAHKRARGSRVKRPRD